MSQVLLLVHIEETKIKFEEYFIDFILLNGRSPNSITEQIYDKFQAYGLKRESYYGQGYDNAVTKDGHIRGVQKCIPNVNTKDMLVPSNSSSFNLAGVHAASVESISATFLSEQNIYKFFSISTRKWDVLKEVVSINVNRSCDTRWYSKNKVVRIFTECTEN